MSKARRTTIDVAEALARLEVGREGAIRVRAGSKPFHERYNSAKAVTDAIDKSTESLSGDAQHFWGKPHG